MCNNPNSKRMLLRIYNDSFYKYDYVKKYKNVDECLKPLLELLRIQGIITMSSCCGHGKTQGGILILPYSAPLAEELGYIIDKHRNLPLLKTYPNKPKYRNGSFKIISDVLVKVSTKHSEVKKLV